MIEFQKINFFLTFIEIIFKVCTEKFRFIQTKIKFVAENPPLHYDLLKLLVFLT